MTLEIKLDNSEASIPNKRIRSDAQIRAEQKSEQHRVQKKVTANFKRNPVYAEKFKRYLDAGIMTQLFVDALFNAPDDPNDYISQINLKKHNLDWFYSLLLFFLVDYLNQ